VNEAAEAGSEYVVGIDLGGTKVRAGIATLDGTILSEVSEPTAAGAGRALVPQITALVSRLATSAGGNALDVLATAIGGAGVPDGEGGRFDSAPNLGDLNGVSLVAELELELGHPVVLENDVNVAAIGELHEGIGRQHDSFAFVSVGTGVGVGLVLRRRLWPGVSGSAGEIGYLPFGADPFDPKNQRRGALEEVAAGDAIARRFVLATGADPLSAVDVFDRAAAGDAHAVASLDEEARWLARALVAIDAVVNPGVFVLGGGIGSRTELLVPIRHWLGRLGRPHLKVRISRLGNLAPIVGAVRLAIDAAPLSTEREAS
jgi:predicted NBD/HSP70 family sugar kinase